MDTPFELYFEGNVFKILSGVCFKFIYLMTFQSLFATFKCNIFLIKIFSNVTFSTWVNHMIIKGLIFFKNIIVQMTASITC